MNCLLLVGWCVCVPTSIVKPRVLSRGQGFAEDKETRVPFGARILEEYEYQTMLQGDISSKLNALVSKLITQETLCLHKSITK
jgi:hypothetical protein